MNTMRTLMALSVLGLASGCSNMSGQTNGAMIGGGIGALAGQAIGGDTESTLIGAGVGALGGALFGNEAEYQQRREQARTERYRHDNGGFTRRESSTTTTRNPDGTYTTTGSETVTSEEESSGYTGLPRN